MITIWIYTESPTNEICIDSLALEEWKFKANSNELQRPVFPTSRIISLNYPIGQGTFHTNGFPKCDSSRLKPLGFTSGYLISLLN